MTENQTYAPENSLILHKIGQLHIIRNFGPIGQNYEGFYDVKKWLFQLPEFGAIWCQSRSVRVF